MKTTFPKLRRFLGSDPAEKARHEKRNKVKAALAEQTALNERLQLMLAQKRELTRRKNEQEPDRHSEAMAPVQARLAEIAAANADALLNGRPFDPQLLHEEAELIRRRDDANVELERAIAAIDATSKSLTKEIESVRNQISGLDNLRAQLKSRELANPLLQRELAVAMNTVHWAQLRLSAATREYQRRRESHDHLMEGLNKIKGREWNHYERGDAQLASHDLQESIDEQNEATRLEEIARSEVDRLREAIIDE